MAMTPTPEQRKKILATVERALQAGKSPDAACQAGIEHAKKLGLGGHRRR